MTLDHEEHVTMASVPRDAGVIRTLFITLRRGFAGKKESQIKIVRSLGLQHREQCVEKPNTRSIRGALDKVKHLVRVETDMAHHHRISLERQRRAWKPPIRVSHDV